MAESEIQKRQRTRTGQFLRALAYFAILALINVLVRGQVARFLSSFFPRWATTLLDGALYLGGVLALTWAFWRFVDRSPMRELGLHRRGWVRKLVAGWALGALLVFLMFVALALGGWLTLESASAQILELIAAVIFTVVVSINEELAFRGYIMQRLSVAWGMPVAVLASSLLFGLVHIVNPNAHPLGILSISLAGVLLACAYLVTRSLWLPIGLHFGWNLMEMHILGFPGSGRVVSSMWRSAVDGPVLLTGGAFGPEGGLVSIVACLLGIAILLFGSRVTLARKTDDQGGNEDT